MKSDIIRAAIILSAGILLATGLWIYFSPYHSCVRAFQNDDAEYDALDVALKCAQLT
jgi:hypothetical protein